MSGEQTVIVRRHWNDYRTLDLPLDKVTGAHWTNVSGGVHQKSPHRFIQVYMRCNLIPEGSDFPHSCQHGHRPHWIKVCVVKKDNTKDVFALLKKAADKDTEDKKQ